MKPGKVSDQDSILVISISSNINIYIEEDIITHNQSCKTFTSTPKLNYFILINYNHWYLSLGAEVTVIILCCTSVLQRSTKQSWQTVGSVQIVCPDPWRL